MLVENAIPDILGNGIGDEVDILPWTEETELADSSNELDEVKRQLQQFQLKNSIDEQIWSQKLEASQDNLGKCRETLSMLKLELEQEKKKNAMLEKVVEQFQRHQNDDSSSPEVSVSTYFLAKSVPIVRIKLKILIRVRWNRLISCIRITILVEL